MAKVPKFVNQQDISKRILHTTAWLAWIISVAVNERMLRWIAERYAGITDLDRVKKWPRRIAVLVSDTATCCLSGAIVCFFADYYIFLLGIPIAILLYGVSIWILIEHYQGPLLFRPHPFGKIGRVFAYLYGALERLIEVIRHGTP
jgi:hypothetical protein